MRDLPYLRLYLCYQRNLGVYSHIIEVVDYNYDMVKTATVMVDLQIQSHGQLCVTFHLCLYSGYQEDIGVYFHIIEVKDSNFDMMK